jgi:hypothetical protein
MSEQAGGAGSVATALGDTVPDRADPGWENLERAAAAAARAEHAAHHGPVTLLVNVVVMTLAGMGLRSHLPHSLLLAVVAFAVLVPGGIALSVMQGLQPEEEVPQWAGELDRYWQWLPERVPVILPRTLAVMGYYLHRLRGRRWLGAHLCIMRSPDGKPVLTG